MKGGFRGKLHLRGFWGTLSSWRMFFTSETEWGWSGKGWHWWGTTGAMLGISGPPSDSAASI